MPPGGSSTKRSASSKAATTGAKARLKFQSRWFSTTNGAYSKAKASHSTGRSVVATPTVTAASPNWRPASSQNRQRSSRDSKLRVAGRARKGDDIANVRHAREEHQQALEPQTEARMRHGAVTS